jgi:hypothetical protein
MTMLLLLATLLIHEIPISQPDVIPMNSGGAIVATPLVVAGDDGFLVAWGEHYLPNTYIATVKVRTYDADGTPRQAVPVTVGAPGQSMLPHAFWNGSEFVVLYSTPASRSGAVHDQPVIFSTRVRPDGSVVEGSQTTLVVSRPGSIVTGLAFDGLHALASVATAQGDRLLKLDREGRLLEELPPGNGPGAIAARPEGGFLVLPAPIGGDVVAGGDRFAAISGGFDGVIARILDGEGSEIERFTLADNGVSASIAWDGSAWIAVYTTEDRDLCTARFTRKSDLVSSCEAPGSAGVAAVAALPRGIFRAWTSGGQLLTDGGIASTMASSSSNPDAVVDDAGLLAAWTETTTDGRSVRVGGLFHNATPRPEYGVPGGASQHSVALSRSASRTLLVWNESPGSFATRIGSDGRPIDTPVRVGNGFRHSVASHGESWVVAWMTSFGINITRVTRDLEVRNTEEFARKLVNQAEPAVAATKNGYLVAWPEYGLGEADHAVFIEPLDADGRRTSAGKFVLTGGAVSSLAMECGPSTCLAAGYLSGGLWTALLRHDGTPAGAPRRIEGHASNVLPVIKAFDDGSFRVYHGNLVTSISPSGEPGNARPWHRDAVAPGAAVTWRGRTTVVYERTGRIFAMPEPMPRMRSVRR